MTNAMLALKLTTIALCLYLGRSYVASDYRVLRRDIADLVMRKYRKRHGLFLLTYAAIAGLMAITPFLNGMLIRVALVAYFSVGAITAVIHRNITGQFSHQRAYFDEDTAEVLLREIDMARDAFMAYRRDILSALIPGIAIMAVLMLPPPPGFGVPAGFGWAAVGLIVAIGVCHHRQWVFIHGKGWPLSFPSIVMIPIRSLATIRKRQSVRPKPLSPVTLTHTGRPLNKIVFIMDESIRGDYTTLVSPGIGTTPYLAGVGRSLVNFGVASSGHNCSSYSRYMLRYGARASDLPAALSEGLNLPGPTLWQYASAAGLRTVYIDGFSNYLRLHSGMCLREASLIDNYVRIPDAVAHERDIRVAECLRAALEDPAPAFIYVDKHGIHMPYDDKVPPGYAPIEAPADASRKERLVTSYKNAMRWNVDEFFRRVLTDCDLSGTAIFYTSDHGQSLSEGGYSASHCSVGDNIVAGEALVPLLAITGDEPMRAALKAASCHMFNRASHFEIFPTLLRAFGFDPAEVEAAYGAGLFGDPCPQRRFLAGFKTSAAWVDVERTDAAMPGV